MGKQFLFSETRPKFVHDLCWKCNCSIQSTLSVGRTVGLSDDLSVCPTDQLTNCFGQRRGINGEKNRNRSKNYKSRIVIRIKKLNNTKKIVFPLFLYCLNFQGIVDFDCLLFVLPF